MRKITSLIIPLLIVLAHVAPAQVSVSVVFEQDQFLPGEAILAAVKIANRSGQTLHLGAESNWLTFFVEAKDGYVVEKLGDVPVVLPFDLESSKVATKRVNLEPYFRLAKPGRYQARATLRIANWDREVTSPPRSFDLIGGARLWEQEFGVPRTNGLPEVRKYILQQANYLKQVRLYARVTDAEGVKSFGVMALGPMVSFGRPEGQVDKHSDLHVLFQTGARSFLYCLVTPDGVVRVRQTYGITTNRPGLAVGDNGAVSVVGGGRLESAEDLPPAPPVESPDEIPPTNAPPANP
jgi:hypothetical protein